MIPDSQPSSPRTQEPAVRKEEGRTEVDAPVTGGQFGSDVGGREPAGGADVSSTPPPECLREGLQNQVERAQGGVLKRDSGSPAKSVEAEFAFEPQSNVAVGWHQLDDMAAEQAPEGEENARQEEQQVSFVAPRRLPQALRNMAPPSSSPCPCKRQQQPGNI